MMKRIKTALISVSDKKNLKSLIQNLRKYRIKLISSGGTFKEIKRLKFECLEVSKFTNSKEILEGRVKTLHPKIHAGILNKRNNRTHLKDMNKNNYENIDLVIVNFYPFEKTLEHVHDHKKILENIDIGGPTLARAAAKNYNDVTVLTSSENYEDLINELKKNKGSTSLKFRKTMSQQAFAETAYYDSVISNYFNKISNINFPQKKTIYGNLIEKLRYGENSHQESAIYSKTQNSDINKIHGKKLSYNNYNDIYTALTISKSLPRNIGTVIVKHANPCGVSIDKNNLKSFKLAYDCDPVSAFGGIICFNFKIKKSLANLLNKIFLEVVIANGFDKEALKILKSKKNIRLIDSSNFSIGEKFEFKSLDHMLLLQSSNINKFKTSDFKVVSKRKPNKDQLKNLIFAFNICRHVKSNAIVLASNLSTIGIGSGQPSRVDSCQIAIDKMKMFNKINKDVVAASDAFFPFVDGVEKLIQSGVTAIIQPSGSIRDKEIINFVNRTNKILVFSKNRHFKH